MASKQNTDQGEVVIRKLKRDDCRALLELVRALAEHHGYLEHLHATVDMYEHAFFKPDSVIGALVAEETTTIIGCAIWHRSFSTFRGSEVIYLEDLSVLPDHRSRGVGLALVKGLARQALEMNAPSIYWIMMGWNAKARKFYQGLGAEIEDNNCYCRIHGAALEALADA